MRRERLDYVLPPEAVALRPVEPRDHARLLVVHIPSGRTFHERFDALPRWLPRGTVLVLNRTRVVRARLEGVKATGGRVTVVVFPRKYAPTAVGGGGKGEEVQALLQRGKIRVGQVFRVGEIEITVVEQEGKWLTLRFPPGVDVEEVLDRHGKMPLPPYIRREVSEADERWYQPLTAREPGSVAAPTASLHFTPRVMEALRQRGVEIVEVVLHVGPGTFLPILTEEVEAHRMLPEYYEVPPEAQARIVRARREGRPVVAVGTTCTRALETWALGEGPSRGYSDLFIYPGYRFRVLDGLVTNFHQPRSTPLALVAAFAGLDLVKRVYEEALRRGYRFLSYGDATLWVRFDPGAT